MKTLLFAALFALAHTHIALADDSGPAGIAFVEAPEQSSGMCVGNTPEDAFACAKMQCVEGGAVEEDCIETKWCQPTGWSVDFFVQHQEGLHWHEVICGLDSAETAMAMESVVCNRENRNYLIECAAVRLINPEGEMQDMPR